MSPTSSHEENMNNYEGLFIMKPDLGEEQVKGVCKIIADSIVKGSGNVKKEEIWGKRPLAYPVKKYREGYYYKIDFTVTPNEISKLEAAYKLNSDILRGMITRR